VASLLREGRQDLGDKRGGALWLQRQALAEPLETVLSDLVTAENGAVIVAEIDGSMLGAMVASYDLDTDGRIATVHELFVVSDARGVGLGEAMMELAVTWATAADCGGIDGYALPGDRATKNYFETFGLVARGIVVHRRLDQGS